MVGALSVVGSSVVDSHTCPCLCLDALPTTNMNLKTGGDVVLPRNSMGKKRILKPPGSLDLSSSFIDSGLDRRLSVKALPGIANRSFRKQRKNRRLWIVSELAGQYEDGFEDVKMVSNTNSSSHIYFGFYVCENHVLLQVVNC